MPSSAPRLGPRALQPSRPTFPLDCPRRCAGQEAHSNAGRQGRSPSLGAHPRHATCAQELRPLALPPLRPCRYLSAPRPQSPARPPRPWPPAPPRPWHRAPPWQRSRCVVARARGRASQTKMPAVRSAQAKVAAPPAAVALKAAPPPTAQQPPPPTAPPPTAQQPPPPTALPPPFCLPAVAVQPRPGALPPPPGAPPPGAPPPGAPPPRAPPLPLRRPPSAPQQLPSRSP